MSEITVRFAEGMPSVWNSGWINEAGNLVAGTGHLAENHEVYLEKQSYGIFH